MTRFTIGIKTLAVLALVAGLGVGLWGLVAPLGVWMGLWDFRQGFTLLRNAHGFANWVAIICLVIGLSILLAAFFIRQQKLGFWSGLVLIGSAVASLSYFVPESFRAPEGENYPPIHDVSTNTINPPEYVEVLPLRASAPNTAVYGGSPNMTPEKLAELQTAAYPDLVPWRTEQSRQEVFARALVAVQQLGWELVSENPEQGRIEATATTFWFRFKDDVVIVVSEENGTTVVNARSLSRVGGGDVGANAKRLRAFFALLKQ